MRINVWDGGKLREGSIDEVKSGLSKAVWYDIEDPSIDDMGQIADALAVPRHVLIGKLRSNYPHIDSYMEHTKIFAWYLDTKIKGKDITNNMGPIIIFTNGIGVVTIGHSWTKTGQRITSELSAQRLIDRSLGFKIIYLTLTHLLEAYEHFVEEFEITAEQLEKKTPPWPKHLYQEAYELRREASSLLRLLHHFRLLMEQLTQDRSELKFSEDEKEVLDNILERSVGAEETIDSTQESMRDLISLHMDTTNHEMNQTMRLIAALTVIVGVPSLISSLLGSNTLEHNLNLLQQGLISLIAMIGIAIFFWLKGWLRIS